MSNGPTSSSDPEVIFDPSSTPTQQESDKDTRKRLLSSPLEYSEAKKHFANTVMEKMNEVTEIETPSEGSSASQPFKNITLGVEDLNCLAEALKSTFHKDMEQFFESFLTTSVNKIVEGVVQGLKDRIDILENRNDLLSSGNESLRDDNEKLKKRVSDLEFIYDSQEQYSRRNCLRISGIKEHESENTDQVVLDLCNKVGVNVTESDIDRSHRDGKAGNPRPRQIIVKFTSYRVRRRVYKARSTLKSKDKHVFINEDLTKTINKLFYEARQMVKNKEISSAWSSDGVILVKDKHDKVRRIERQDDLLLI